MIVLRQKEFGPGGGGKRGKKKKNKGSGGGNNNNQPKYPPRNEPDPKTGDWLSRMWGTKENHSNLKRGLMVGVPIALAATPIIVRKVRERNERELEKMRNQVAKERFLKQQQRKDKYNGEIQDKEENVQPDRREQHSSPDRDRT